MTDSFKLLLENLKAKRDRHERDAHDHSVAAAELNSVIWDLEVAIDKRDEKDRDDAAKTDV